MDPNAPKNPDGQDNNRGFDSRVFSDWTRVNHEQSGEVLYDDSDPNGLIVRINGHSGIFLPFNIEQTPAEQSENTSPVDLVSSLP